MDKISALGISHFLSDKRCQSILDLGCCNESVLDWFASMPVGKNKSVSFGNFVGVDDSEKQIALAAERFPQTEWVHCNLVDFLFTRHVNDGQFALIFDAGCSLLIADEEKCTQALQRVRALLVKSSGILFVIVDKKIYQHWNLVNCNRWSKDVFEHARNELGECFDFSGGANLIYCFGGRNPINGNQPSSNPATMEISIGGDKSSFYRITYDGITKSRLKYLQAKRDNCKARVELSSISRTEKYEAMANAAYLKAKQTLPSVLIPTDSAIISPSGIPPPTGKKLDLYKDLSARDHSFNPVPFPGRLGNTRHVSRALFDVLGSDCGTMLLGVGLRDYFVDNVLGKALIGLHEFRFRLEWIIRSAYNYGMKVIYILPQPENLSCLLDKHAYQPIVAQPYREAIYEICAGYELPLIARSQKESLREYIHRIVEAITKTVAAPGPNAPELYCLPTEQDTSVQQIKIGYEDGSEHDVETQYLTGIFDSLPFVDVDTSADEGAEIHLGKSIHIIGGRSEFECFCQRKIISELYSRHDPSYKPVMIIGDSIRMRQADGSGYGIYAYHQLLGKANLYHVPHNCGGTTAHLSYLKEWLVFQPEIVHINAGLHDLSFNLTGGKPLPAYNTIDIYAKNLRVIVNILRESGVKQVIWGLNTPVQEEWHAFHPLKNTPRKFGRRNCDVRQYNDIACDVMAELGVPVTDMFTPLWNAGIEDVVFADGVHLNSLGSQIVGKLVANVVENYL